jgi:hypothetical protein
MSNYYTRAYFQVAGPADIKRTIILNIGAFCKTAFSPQLYLKAPTPCRQLQGIKFTAKLLKQTLCTRQA